MQTCLRVPEVQALFRRDSCVTASIHVGIFAMEPKGCTLRAGRKGILTKMGEFTMVSAEQPNLSTIPWVRPVPMF
jgi:hypothetical protein